MPTWHQARNPVPLYHPTKWRAYDPRVEFLSLITFDTKEECMEYCARTGEIPLMPFTPKEQA